MNAVLEKLSKIGIVPVVKIDRVEDAVPLAKALCAGGLPCAEVTFRTSAAAGAIKAMTENFPQMWRWRRYCSECRAGRRSSSSRRSVHRKPWSES